MLQTDYFLRLVREFGEALQQLRRQKGEQRRRELERLFDAYVGPYAFYHTAEMDDVMDSFGRFPEHERLWRMEMLAQLYYVAADDTLGPMRDINLRRALDLFVFIDRHDKTFKFDRVRAIADIKGRLERASGA